MSGRKKVLIIGSGLAGLATALRLSTRGYEVEILEKFHQPGGRLNQLQKDGFTFDLAPTFFSMSYEFKEFIQDCKTEMPFKFIELDPLYTVHFEGNPKQYRIYKDIEKLAGEFGDSEPNFKEKMDKYLQQAGQLFHDTENRIIRKNFDSLSDFILQLMKVPPGHLPKLFRSMWTELNRYFSSYEAKVIFSLVAFFLGATPFNTPAVYSLLSYTELKHDGYYNVEGGMYKIIEGIIRELEKRNVRIHYQTEIVSAIYEKRKLHYLVDQQNKAWQADMYVINSDAAWFRGKVFNRKKYSEERLKKQAWTLAPFTLYLGVKGKIEKLEHHNYFLGSNFQEYANTIFKNEVIEEKPYYYVNVPSRYNPGHAPEGCESLFILCPVPDLRYKNNWDDREQVASNIITDLSNKIDFDIQHHLVSKTILDPMNWQQMFNLYQGSGLGLAHNINQIGYFRPKNKDEKFSNVYYTGASTTPGTGLPMMMISSKLVTERILHDS